MESDDDIAIQPEEIEEIITTEKSFSDIGVQQWLIDTLHAMSIRRPTEVQANCIPSILAGNDCIGGAKTGSGKTAAFALPILQKLSEDPFGIYAVVLTPTRELAFQIAEQFRVLGKQVNLRQAVVVGGLDMMTQALELSKRPHIIVATPGRLVDLLRSSSDTIDLKRIRFLVLDEADRLFSPTFKDHLDYIYDSVSKTRQTLHFTATMTPEVLAIANGDRKPHVWQSTSDIATVTSLTQNYIFVPSHVREAYLVYLLRSESFKDASCIIFVGRCRTAELLRVMLIELDVRCTALHSDMSQRERLNSLGKFRASAVKVLIATDVGSRGLDIPSVQLVFNFDLPRDPADYIHRVGRTARAGRGGMAISLVTERDVELVHQIEEKVNKQLTEYEISENKVLEILQEVVSARNIASMQLYDEKFGEKREQRKEKRGEGKRDILKRKRKERKAQRIVAT